MPTSAPDALVPDAATRAFLDGMGGLILFAHGPNHEPLWMNRACVNLYGDRCTLPEVLGAFWACGGKDLLDEVWRSGVPTSRSHERVRNTVAGQQVDRWLDIRVHAWSHADGARGGVWVELHDVSGLVAAWREAETERRNLYTLMHQAPGIIAIRRGPELVGQMFNRAYVELMGGRELVGRSLVESIPEAHKQLPIHEHICRTGESIRHDAALFRRRPDDPVEPSGEVWLNLVYQPLRDAEGAVIGTMLFGVDVTGQVVARREAEAQRARVEELLSTLDVVVWERPVGGPGFSFLAGRIEQLLGWPRARWDAHGFWDELVHPDDVGVVRAALSDPAAQFPHTPLRYRLRHADGHDVWIQDFIRVIHDADGRPLHLRGVMLDVSTQEAAQREKERLQAQMLQAQKLEGIGLLAGGIAHDFNNLLAVILGSASLAALRLSDGHPARPAVEDILATSQRAADLTRQLLAYAGKARTKISTLDLGGQVREIVQLLDATLPKKVRLDLLLTPALPTIDADPGQLQQVVMNLVINGAEAIAEQGTVTVHTAAEELCAPLPTGFVGSAPEPGRYVVLSVSDTGAGMDAETCGRIFDPFYTTKANGRGLGLAAVAGIVRTHRAGLRIQSTPGVGTRFWVYFPASSKAETPRVPLVEAVGGPGRGRVLLVDDEHDVRTTARLMLEHLGYTVFEAENGLQALDAAGRAGEELAAIIVDKSMPVMDGDECIRELTRRGTNVPIILTSGYPDPGTVDAIPPYQGFLQKPYSVRQLASAVGKVIAEARR